MENQIVATVVSMHIENATSEESLLRTKVTLQLVNQCDPTQEQVALTVLLPTGIDTLSALQDAAIGRAALILASTVVSGPPEIAAALSKWAKLAEQLPKLERSN